jgi:hypothetical protein
MKVYLPNPVLESTLTTQPEAAKNLAKLHAHGDVNDPFVQAQLEDIKAEILKSKEIGSAR